MHRRSRPEPPPIETAPPPPPSPRAPSGIESAIREIQRKYAYYHMREGCHALSETLRRYWEKASRHRLSTLTVSEIGAALGDVSAARLFRLLAQLQFARSRPTRSDFHGICELAIETVSKRDAVER